MALMVWSTAAGRCSAGAVAEHLHLSYQQKAGGRGQREREAGSWWRGSGLVREQGVRESRLSPSPCPQDDHGRAARHLRQHAGRVAFLACGPLSLRGSKQPQEAGMKVALSPPQGSRT